MCAVEEVGIVQDNAAFDRRRRRCSALAVEEKLRRSFHLEVMTKRILEL
mgnify:CR=1 FL=1